MSTKLLHKISDQIKIEETIGGINSQRGDRVLVGGQTFPIPGNAHKLILYNAGKFVCEISFACPESEVERYRAEYIEFLLNHFKKSETVQA